MTRFIILVLCLLPAWAYAQTQTQTLQEPPDVYATPAPQMSRDPPPGFPYNTGSVGTGGNADVPIAQVPLRDFISSRQDLQYADLSRQISQLAAFVQQMQDERDRQYAQRFAAQQDAMEAALTAAKEAVQAALASAKEAVVKAEDAANARFEAGNEIKAAMENQQLTFMRKDEANVRFNAVEEKADSVYDRINALQAQKEGGIETWGFIALVGGLLLGLAGLLYGMNKDRRARVEL